MPHPPTAERNWLYRLDESIRRFDFWFNRTSGGCLERQPKVFRGHPLPAFLTFGALLLFLTLGPSFRIRQWPAYLMLWVVYGLYAGIAWLAPVQRVRLFTTQFLTILALFVLLFLIPATGDNITLRIDDLDGKEMAGGLYPHLLLPLTLVLACVVGLARGWAKVLLARFRDGFPDGAKPENLLNSTELFDAPERRPQPQASVIVLALLTTPLRYPIELLLVPSAYLVAFAHGGETDLWVAGGLLCLSWLLLALGDSHERLRHAQSLLQRLFSYGGLWVTSLTVIGLALAWISDFGYVRTVMEGDRLLVVQYIVASYLLFWWHEYWLNRAICEELLKQFGPPMPDIPEEQRRSEQICYSFARAGGPIRVKSENQFLQIHGAGRFVVVGEQLLDPAAPGTTGPVVWQFHDRTSLFTRLAESAPSASRAAVQQHAGRLEQRLKAYFTLSNFGVVLAIGLMLWGIESQDKQAVVEARDTFDDDNRISLAKLLIPQPPAGSEVPEGGGMAAAPRRPRVILLAASGGGTRAALYTTSLLYGLSRIKALPDVRLVSGVSGGGLSVAWFAAHRDRLIVDDFAVRNQAWEDFFAAMESPFIVDVLRGGSEARIAHGVLLGQLLAESFGQKFEEEAVWRFGRVSRELGLVLNTTLCGTFPPDIGAAKSAGSNLRFSGDHASAIDAGGRLIFTNLNCREAFTHHEHPSAPHERLQYVVVDDPRVPLAAAAALNANFPPVFPNAPVDITDTDGRIRRYWVTDGGAEENRGVISLLYLLRQAIEDAKNSTTPVIWPEIHIIVAEGSAGSVDYAHDRGVGAASAASGKLAAGFADILLHDIEQHFLAAQSPPQGQPATITMHVLPMPTCLRFGGIGTHWMLPKTVRIRKTDVPAVWAESSIQLTRPAVAQIIRDLHLPDTQQPHPAPPELQNEYQHIWDWIHDDPLESHPRKWQALGDALK